MRELNLPTARVFEPLLAPGLRYRGAHGGRGSGKSHFFAEDLIEASMREPGDFGGEGLRSVCLREVQKDLKQSSKLLIESKLRQFRITEADGFKLYTDCITTPGDGLIIFKGMSDYTAESIKSLEGFKRGWWDEAQTASLRSLNLYRPTLRARGSVRDFSWNPTRKSDPIEALLRGAILPTGAKVVEANWRDNPFWNEELELERLDFLRTQPDQYPHIWDGEYVSVIAGAYFAAELVKAKNEGRLRGFVAADPLLSIRVFVDIGGTGARADSFVMWVVQFVGREIRLLDYYESVGQPVGTHLDWLRRREYKPGRAQIWLPHDGDTQDKVYDASYEKALGKQGAGYDVTVVPNQGKGAAKARIEAARRHFGACRFNVPDVVVLGADGEPATPTCAAGLEALGWYHEKRDDVRLVGLGPDHDWSSHGSDAFGLMCICADRIFAEANRGPVSDPNKGFRRAI